ncbi:MAG: DUF3307 domain-containing protein [Rhodobacteraceae bacterium]|nr:DUF3307 domain-containing protein [Paracoccaceae bacterium]
MGVGLTDLVTTVLILMALLLVKHMFADYFMQTPKMLSGRGQYWHMGRAQHVSVHSIGSIIVFVLVGAPTLFILAVCIAEWVIHFHIDWAKAKHSDSKCLSPTDAGFWRAFGMDQTLHGLTYVAMVWAWVVYAA